MRFALFAFVIACSSKSSPTAGSASAPAAVPAPVASTGSGSGGSATGSASSGSAGSGSAAPGPLANPEDYLHRIEKHVATAYAARHVFPKGKIGPAPAIACCAQPDKVCPVSPDPWATDSMWTAIDFSVDEASRFQFTYASDGKVYQATAIGDPECTGKTVTYKLDGHLDHGSIKTTLTH